MQYNQSQLQGTGGLAVAVICFFAVVLIYSSCAVVGPGYRGISVTLGKVDPIARSEGLQFKKPFIEDIVKVPVQQLSVQSKATSFSSDLQTVTFSYTVLYRLPESRVVELYQQYKGDPYSTLVEPRVQESIKQVAAAYKAEEMVKNRDPIKKAVYEKVVKEIGGLIDVRDIPITNIDLTDEMERAIELKQVTEQQALAKQYELQKAQKEAEITVVNAKAEAESVRIKGEALANAPRVIELEIVKKWDGRSPQTVVTSSGGANVILPMK